jgi:hypothetical protein
LTKFWGFSYGFFVEGVEEVLKDDALTLQESIGSILASLACLEGDQSTVETTAFCFSFFLHLLFRCRRRSSKNPRRHGIGIGVLLVVTSPR